MEIKTFLISEIEENENNPRITLTKRDKEYKQIKQSIEEFGLVEPLIINKRTNKLISGHQRLNVLKELGHKEVDVSLVDLSEEQEKQLMIILNKISGRWDNEKLYKALAELGSKKLTGFSFRDIEDLKIKLRKFDEVKENIPKKTEILVKYGDKINLDNNVLKIGDVCSFNDLEDLVGDDLIDLVIADPPYNINSQYGGYKKVSGMGNRGYANDNMSDEEYYEFCRKWINNFCNILKEGGVFYIFNHFGNADIIVRILKENKSLLYHQTIIWDKTYPMLNRAAGVKAVRTTDFLHQYEIIFYGWKQGKKHFISNASKTISDIWSIKKVFNLKMQHIAEKPQELIQRMLLLSSNQGEKVLDLFSVSGSTLFACKKNNRQCFSIEIDVEFAQRIVNRYYDEG